MAKQSTPILVLTVVATGTIAPQRFVTAAAAQTGADGNCIGVSRNAAVSGDRLTIDSKGTATVEAGAAVALGATVKSDASGRAITWATSGGRLGVALEAAGAAGQFIEIRLLDNAA